MLTHLIYAEATYTHGSYQSSGGHLGFNITLAPHVESTDRYAFDMVIKII